MGAGEDIATKGLLGRGLEKGMLGGMLGLVAAGCFFRERGAGKGNVQFEVEIKIFIFLD